ncbi:MAG: DUF2752 domain-containing protein [Ruminococcus bromii]|nr:DUF2752 domain-containing protein [Ruminococcus bromii]
MRRLWKRRLLWGAVVVACLVLIYHCPFRYLFGVACPGCGMTRALLAAVFSDFEAAFAFHPLFPLLIPAALYLGLRESGRLRLTPRAENTYILLFAGLFILVYVLRLCAGDPIVQPDFSASWLARVLHLLQR